MDNLKNYTHNRFNPLTNEWIKVSPHRGKRPWNGQVDEIVAEKPNHYDESCYLCPTNTRTSGITNPDYKETYTFINDFSAITQDSVPFEETEGPNNLLKAKGERGICKVICFSPIHDLTIAKMNESQIEKIVEVWQKEYTELAKKDFINHIQIFENRGAQMGCSNPHPHGQLWAEEIIPDLPKKELINQKEYFLKNNSSMLLDYANYEIEQDVRVVVKDTHFIAVVPYWAVWPYEILVVPYRRVIQSINELNEEEKKSLAIVMKRIGVKYDNLFLTNFPYSMGIHQKPTDNKEYEGCIMHLHYFPPLLRSASVKKFMVGYELLAMPQRDITAEQAAKRLKELDNIHYLEKKRS